MTSSAAGDRLRALAVLAALAIAVAAGAVRVRPLAPDLSELAAERGLTPAALALDADSAWRLRAVELALATQTAPRRDMLVGGYPGAALPWPPFYPLAVGALFERSHGRAATLSRADEEELETLAARLGPALAVLATIATCAAARSLGSTFPGALLAAALYAAWVLDGRFGDLGPGPWCALLAVLVLASVQRALRSSAIIDGAPFALFAGLAASLACASDPSMVVLLSGVGLAFAVAAARSGELGRAAFRGGLLALVAAFFPALAATHGGLIGSHALRDPTACLPRLVLHLLVPLCCAQFVTPLPSRHLRLIVVGCVSIALLAVDSVLREWLAELWSQRATWAWQGPALACCAALAAALAARLGRVYVFALGLVALFGVAREAHSRSLAHSSPARAEREVRADLVAALRWLRANSDSSGSWNHPRASQVGGVLSAPEDAGWIAYHARRRAALAPSDPLASEAPSFATFALLSPRFATSERLGSLLFERGQVRIHALLPPPALPPPSGARMGPR